MRDEIADIITHSLGLGQSDTPYRKYYCSPPTPALEEAVRRGLMTGPHKWRLSAGPIWYVTAVGAGHVGSALPKDAA